MHPSAKNAGALAYFIELPGRVSKNSNNTLPGAPGYHAAP